MAKNVRQLIAGVLFEPKYNGLY